MDSLFGSLMRDAEMQAKIHQRTYENEMMLATTELENKVLASFKKSYIKIRTDNVVLDPSTAIELTKMIHSEADTLTFKDTQ